jgi:hypothetical protein
MDGHIRHLADRADIARPCAGSSSEQYCVTGLAEPTPRVLHDVAFNEDTLSILQLKMVFHCKRLPFAAPTNPATPFIHCIG